MRPTLLRMGGDGAAAGRTRSGHLQGAFAASFLPAAVLPAGLTLIRAPDPGPTDPAPWSSPSATRVLRHGRAVWLGAPDAPLYRLDDERWQLGNARRAAELAFELAGPEPDATRASPGTSATAPAVTLRPDPDGDVTLVVWLGPAVARLRIGPGEGAALPAELVAGLERLTGDRIAQLAALAAGPRRPWWRKIPRTFGDVQGPGSASP